MMNKTWKIITRPIIETLLNNHAKHHRVNQPLILHGPRGVGKTTLILQRLQENWNKGPHFTGYVDLAHAIKDHSDLNNPFPWTSWSASSEPPPSLLDCKAQLETCLESMAEKGVCIGAITSTQIFSTLNKWHRLDTALHRIILQHSPASSKSRNMVSRRVSASVLWDRAVFALSARSNAREMDVVLGFGGGEKRLSLEEAAYFRESLVALRLAKEVLEMQRAWRANAIAQLNRTRGFSRSLANSCTDWPCLLIELLSQSAEMGQFQPKLVINNIEILKYAILTDDSMVSGSMYHDSLIWRIIALGANEMCLPVLLVSSDSYYSYRAFMDFGFPDVFISRETFGWSPQEAKMHMVPDYFTDSEWTIIVEVLGPTSRHLSELYALRQSSYYERVLEDKTSTFEDIIDAYLAYLQVSIVNPAMDKALNLLQKFAKDARNGKIPKDRLRFGASWRHLPKIDEPSLNLDWAKLQLMDFVQSLVNTEFGVNYLADCSLEIFDDPCTGALLEVGLLYAQRDPSFIRPISRGIQRCLVRWLVQERLQMSFINSFSYLWHRVIRGRYYRHLMLQIGYNKI